jgi:hypothetical protein
LILGESEKSDARCPLSGDISHTLAFCTVFSSCILVPRQKIDTSAAVYGVEGERMTKKKTVVF